MIIWGHKGRTKTIGEGTFFCPNCRTTRTFKHEKVSRFFTLYFIPLFETKKLGEYIECQGCLLTFKPEILQASRKLQDGFEASSRIDTFIEEISKNLDDGVPIQQVSKNLKSAGLSEEDITTLVLRASSGDIKQCKNCSLAYKGSVSFCSICGSKL